MAPKHKRLTITMSNETYVMAEELKENMFKDLMTMAKFIEYLVTLGIMTVVEAIEDNIGEE